MTVNPFPFDDEHQNEQLMRPQPNALCRTCDVKWLHKYESTPVCWFCGCEGTLLRPYQDFVWSY